MSQRMISFAVLTAAAICGLASAQGQPQGNERQIESARVLAGVREYPEVIVDAMVTLARHPDWLEKIMKKAQAGQDLKAADATMPDNVRNAVQALADFPEAILLADARRDEMALLRDVRIEAPQGADIRLKQLRADFAAGRREGALRWQEALQGQNEATDAYRELLTRFCKEMRTRVPNYACVEVTDRNYYFVCPPDESIMGFAQAEKANENLWRMMTSWWERYGMDRVDQLAIAGRGMPSSRAENALIDASSDARKNMWKTGDGTSTGPIDLVPVALQPMADQPEEARLAFAVAEHERLWAPPQDAAQPTEPNQPQPPAIAGQPQPVLPSAMAADDLYDDAQVQVEPPMDDQQPGVIVTPARPEMIIPPNAPATRDEPIIIAGDDDDDMVVYGGLDDDDMVELGPDAVEVAADPLIVESSPTVVYESPTTVVVPGATYYPTYYTWGSPYYPTFSSFGFSFGYSNFGRGYPWYYPYSYYRPCGRTYSYYPRFCNDRIYHGGHRNIVLNGNYSDGRVIFGGGRRNSYYGGRDSDRDRFIFRRDGSGYGAVSALSQGQRFGDEVGQRTRSGSPRIGGLSDRIGGVSDRPGAINRSNDRDGVGRSTVRSGERGGDRPRVVRRSGDGSVRSSLGANDGQSGGSVGSSSARQGRSLRGVAPQSRSGGNPGTIRSLRPGDSSGSTAREALRGFKGSRSSIGQSGSSGARSSGNPGIRSFRGSSSQGARSAGSSSGSRQIIRREGKRP